MFKRGIFCFVIAFWAIPAIAQDAKSGAPEITADDFKYLQNNKLDDLDFSTLTPGERTDVHTLINDPRMTDAEVKKNKVTDYINLAVAHNLYCAFNTDDKKTCSD